MITLTQEEKEMIIIGLNMRRNYIETGSVTLSAKDINNVDENIAWRDYHAKINTLSTDQMCLIIKTEELIGKLHT